MWSVGPNVKFVVAKVPSGTPLTARAVTLNECAPGAMFVNKKEYDPFRSPPLEAASSVRYINSFGRETLTQRAAADPEPAFVKFT